jgi:hypothetical protein
MPLEVAMDSKTKIAGGAAVLFGVGALKACMKGAVIVGAHTAVTGTETGLRAMPHAMPVIERGVETGAVGRAAVGHFDDLGAATHSAGDTAAASSDDAAHQHSWASETAKKVGEETFQHLPDIADQIQKSNDGDGDQR